VKRKFVTNCELLYLADTFVLEVHKRTHLFGTQIYAHAHAVVIGSLIKYQRRRSSGQKNYTTTELIKPRSSATSLAVSSLGFINKKSVNKSSQLSEKFMIRPRRDSATSAMNGRTKRTQT